MSYYLPPPPSGVRVFREDVRKNRTCPLSFFSTDKIIKKKKKKYIHISRFIMVEIERLLEKHNFCNEIINSMFQNIINIFIRRTTDMGLAEIAAKIFFVRLPKPQKKVLFLMAGPLRLTPPPPEHNGSRIFFSHIE